jgi:hypothetical protein
MIRKSTLSAQAARISFVVEAFETTHIVRILSYAVHKCIPSSLLTDLNRRVFPLPLLLHRITPRFNPHDRILPIHPPLQRSFEFRPQRKLAQNLGLLLARDIALGAELLVLQLVEPFGDDVHFGVDAVREGGDDGGGERRGRAVGGEAGAGAVVADLVGGGSA